MVEQLEPEQEQEQEAVIVEQPQPQQKNDDEPRSLVDEETVQPPGHTEAAAAVAMGDPPQQDAEADEEEPQSAPEPEPAAVAPAARAAVVPVLGQPDVECKHGPCNAQATVVLRPCGHRALCQPCYAELQEWLASGFNPSFFCPRGLACVLGQDVQGVVELPPAAIQQLITITPPAICGAHGCGNRIGRRRYFNCRAIPGNKCAGGFSPFCYDCSIIHHNTCPRCGEGSYVDVWPH